MACRTPYCYGDCDECLDDKRREEEQYDEECPRSKKCNVVTINIKTDKCTTCGQVFNY